jgi:D-alanyl-D-alanine carboxypeptidase (penicillin-binding protein 5/6)
MGSPNITARENASAALLNYGFNFFQTRKLYAANTPIMTLPVWKGAAEEVKLGVPNDVYATFARGQESSLGAAADVAEPLFAPLNPKIPAGNLRVTLGDQTLGTYPLHPLEEVPEAGFFGRLADDVKLWFR